MEKERKKINKKENQKQKRQRLGVLLCVALLFCVIFYILKLQMDLANKKSQLVDVNTKISETQTENDSISNILNSGNERDIIEKIAREEFNYVLPDERVFYDISGN